MREPPLHTHPLDSIRHFTAMFLPNRSIDAFLLSSTAAVASVHGSPGSVRFSTAGFPGSTRYCPTYYRDPKPTFCHEPVGSTCNAQSGGIINR